jgi:tryptophan synthase alpha subunit
MSGLTVQEQDERDVLATPVGSRGVEAPRAWVAEPLARRRQLAMAAAAAATSQVALDWLEEDALLARVAQAHALEQAQSLAQAQADARAAECLDMASSRAMVVVRGATTGSSQPASQPASQSVTAASQTAFA